MAHRVTLPIEQPTEHKRPDGKDLAYLAKVAQLPCVICNHSGHIQKSRTQVHHCIHGRYSGAKVPDRQTIPLCEGHHLGLRDTSKIAIHDGKETWREAHGFDVDYIAWTQDQVERLEE